MAKSRNPDSYNPLIRSMLSSALTHGDYTSGPMTKKQAETIRFDIYGYRQAYASKAESEAEKELTSRFDSCAITIDMRDQEVDGAIQEFAHICIKPGGAIYSLVAGALEAGLRPEDLADTTDMDALAQRLLEESR